MQYYVHRFFAIFVSIVLTTFSFIAVKAYGNNWIWGKLRVDLAAITTAQRYSLRVLSTSAPTSGSTSSFTTAWLSIYINNGVNQDNYRGFTQVGLITYPNSGLRWFVYSHETTNCLYGNRIVLWGNLGCLGDQSHLVGYNQWHRVELVKNNGESYWRARIYDATGSSFTDAATIPFTDN